MLIKRAILENFGLYGGRNEFDLAPRLKYGSYRPVLVLGGKNGAGKTTLLDAIRLTLYGRASLGPRVSQKDYASFLRNRIHRPKGALLEVTFAAVGLEFDYVTMGETNTYLVERSWERANGSSVNEQLTVLKNGQPLREVAPEHWDDFVRGIVPERLSQLFFFDGERIRDIAEDETGPEALADSIRSLLGLDLVERLTADLSICSARVARKTSRGQERAALEKTTAEIEKLTAELADGRDELAGFATRLDGVRSEIRKKEDYLRQEGYGYAEKRDEFKAQEATLLVTIENLQKELREECERLYPLSLCPDVAAFLKEQLAAECEFQKWQSLKTEVEAIQKDIASAVHSSPKLRDTRVAKGATNRFLQIVADVIQRRTGRPPKMGSGSALIQDLSERETQDIIRSCETAEKQSAPKAKLLAKDLMKAEQSLLEVQVALGRAPDESALKPHVEELAALNQRLGALTQEQSHCKEKIAAMENRLAALNRENMRLIEKQREREGAEGRLRLTETLQQVLAKYQNRLTSEKIATLRSAVAECFNRLCRKGDLLAGIDIDPRTFAVTLFDRENRPIPKEELSAGEKQIFAISLLWGLARTSGRPLPVIIDTPLARLDSDHRKNIVNNYFPFASHQVLILSTDTEVDQRLLGDLSPHISHCYHLEYDATEGRTRPVEGYFWKEPANAEA